MRRWMVSRGGRRDSNPRPPGPENPPPAARDAGEGSAEGHCRAPCRAGPRPPRSEEPGGAAERSAFHAGVAFVTRFGPRARRLRRRRLLRPTSCFRRSFPSSSPSGTRIAPPAAVARVGRCVRSLSGGRGRARYAPPPAPDLPRDPVGRRSVPAKPSIVCRMSRYPAHAVPADRPSRAHSASGRSDDGAAAARGACGARPALGRRGWRKVGSCIVRSFGGSGVLLRRGRKRKIAPPTSRRDACCIVGSERTAAAVRPFDIGTRLPGAASLRAGGAAVNPFVRNGRSGQRGDIPQPFVLSAPG